MCLERDISRIRRHINTNLTSKNDINPYRIFVNIVHGLFGIKSVFALNRDRDKSSLDFEVPRKLLESHLCVRAHDDIRSGFVDGFTSSLAFLLPDSLHRQPAKLNCLRRACRRRSYGLMCGRCMP